MKKTIVEKHFDEIAESYDSGKEKYSYYYDSLKKLLGELISKNKKVFEIGCGTGDLLASLDPKLGYGMDISDQMITISKIKYQKLKNVQFSTAWPKRNLPAGRQEFDYIFMSDVIEHLDNPQETFNKIQKLMAEKTVFICTMANPLWEPLLMFWERQGWKMPEGPHRRVGIKECRLWIEESGMRITEHDYRLLIPVKIPLVTDFANKYLEKYFKKLCFTEYFVAVKA